MTSLFDQAIKEGCDRAFAKMIAPGGWLREQIRLHVDWTMQGFEPGYGIKERAAFTKTVADRIHERARERFVVLGVPMWLTRWPRDRCEEMAEYVVTNWLQSDGIKFGDPRYFWTDGRDIADEEMSCWENP